MLFSRELTAASARPIVLAILSRGESYGYDIIRQVKTLSGGEIQWAEGALYPVLHRLERQGLIEAFWQTSEQGRKRKYYRLKQEGRHALAEDRKQWITTNQVLTILWCIGFCTTLKYLFFSDKSLDVSDVPQQVY